MPRNDPILLVIPSSIPSKFKNLQKNRLNFSFTVPTLPKQNKIKRIYLSSKVFKDGGEINGGTSADTIGVFPSFEETGDTANREL